MDEVFGSNNGRIWRLGMTPAAAPALRDSKRYSAELDELIIKGVDSTALEAMVIGLRKMKENLSSRRRLPKEGVTPTRDAAARKLIGNRDECGQIGQVTTIHS